MNIYSLIYAVENTDSGKEQFFIMSETDMSSSGTILGKLTETSV